MVLTSANSAAMPLLDGVQLPAAYLTKRYSLISLMDSFGNRVWTAPIASGQATIDQNYHQYFGHIITTITASPTGALLVGGKYSGEFSGDSTTSLAPKAYVFEATPGPVDCSAGTEFDTVMSDINDLLSALGV